MTSGTMPELTKAFLKERVETDSALSSARETLARAKRERGRDLETVGYILEVN